MSNSTHPLLQTYRATSNLASIWHDNAERAREDSNQSTYAVYFAVKKALAYDAEARRLLSTIRAEGIES